MVHCYYSYVHDSVLSTSIEITHLENYGAEWTTVEFDFLIDGEFLRLPLLQHLQMKNISTETTICVEYLER